MPGDRAFPALRIALFGQPSLEYAGQRVKWSAPPKTLPLLAYLVLRSSTALSRDSIAFALWPDDPEETARANLRRHLYQLQRSLPPADGEPWLLADADSLQWNPQAEAWVDVHEFHRLISVPEKRSEAVALYAGDLVENCYDEWILAERERLRTDYMAALYGLIVEHRSKRQWGDGIKAARALLLADPWREDALRQLMSLQYESGDRAGALQAYLDFHRRLQQEMGVDPMPETIALRQRILHNVGTLERHAEEHNVGKRRSTPALPFVGRDAEMQHLMACWAAAAKGATSYTFVEGEAGIGKSRLCSELALRVEAEGGRVLWGATSSPEATPYQSLADALRHALSYISALKLDADTVAAGATLIPELRARRPDVANLATGHSDENRQRLLQGLAEIVKALAMSRPLLLILEDVQWAGEATLTALRYFAEAIADSRALLLITNREEDVSRGHPLRALQRSLMAAGKASSISLGRLGRADVECIVKQLPALGDHTTPSLELFEHSEGNCLFLAQLVDEMLEPAMEAQRAQTVGVTELPRGLRQLIDARLAHLSPETRSLAEICSVLGAGFNAELAAEVSGWSKDRVFNGFDELLDRRLIGELPKHGWFEYSFSHHLIRLAVYDRITPNARVARHRRAGHVLADLTLTDQGEIAAEIARHLELGEDNDQAARYHLLAADFALRLFADHEALEHARRAAQLAADRPSQARAVLLLESIHSRQGLRAPQAHDLATLAALAEELEDQELRAEVLHRRIHYARALGDREHEAQLIAELAMLAAQLREKRWLARAKLAAATLAMHSGDLSKADAEAQEALSLLRTLGDKELEVDCLCLQSDIQTQRGALDLAEASLRAASQSAEAAGKPTMLARAYLAISRAAIMQHQFARCLHAAEQARALFVSAHDREGEADADARLGSVLARLQRYEDARRANQRAALLYESIGKDEGRAGQLVNAASLDARLGLLSESVAKLQQAASIFAKLGEVRGVTVCALNLSFAYLSSGQLEFALDQARHALTLARQLEHKAFTAQALANLGAVERDRGDCDAALAHMQEALSMQESVSRPADQVNDLADMALAYLVKGDLSAAQQAADRMLAAADESTDAAFWPQGLFWTAARIARARRDHKNAHALLGRAHDYLTRIAAQLQEPEVHRHYLALPVNAQIQAAFQHGDWPKIAGDKPARGRPAGRRA